MNVVTVALRKRRRFHGNGLAFTVFMGFLGFASFPAAARDTVEDEFNTLADQIQSPPSASWMQHAYSTNSMPIPSDRDPVDVLLRRTATLLGEFNQDGLLDSEAAELAVLAQENASISVTSTAERLALFRKVSAVSRRVAFANPLLKFKDIVFLKRKKSTYNHMVDCYFGFTAVPGGGIYILKDAFSDNPALVDVLQDSVCENGRFMGQNSISADSSAPAFRTTEKPSIFAMRKRVPAHASGTNTPPSTSSR